jgi:hypothetical protein
VCRWADARLRRCEDYLRRGLINEAIHLAEVAPPVLEVVSVLDFPDRGQWDEIVNLYNLPAAPRVNIDRAGTLNQAYAQHQLLEPLLREHRRLALARAPLHERLAVLRQLAQADPGNPLWLDDVREFEGAALAEVARLGEEAHRRNDVETLEALVQEVEEGTWQAPPPPGLKAQLRSLLTTANVARARERLPEIVRNLDRAMKRGDVDGAASLLAGADEELARAPLPADDALLLALARARGWVEERQLDRQAQAEFEQVLAGFVGMLDAHVPVERLQEAWTGLRRSRRPIPAEIQNRYRQLRDEQKAAEAAKRRYWTQVVNGTVLAIAAPLVTGVLVLVVYVVVRIIRSP